MKKYGDMASKAEGRGDEAWKDTGAKAALDTMWGGDRPPGRVVGEHVHRAGAGLSAGRAAERDAVRSTDRIYIGLENMIHAGALRPGDELLAERTLAEVYGVARGSLRNVLLRLRDQGLLSVEHGRATRVVMMPWAQPLPAADDDSDVTQRDARWQALAAQARTQLIAATFDTNGESFDSAMLAQIAVALQLLRRHDTVVGQIIAIDMCHRLLVDLCPPKLLPTLGAALRKFPLSDMRDALEEAAAASMVWRLVGNIQQTLVKRDCGGIKRSVSEYLAFLASITEKAGVPISNEPEGMPALGLDIFGHQAAAAVLGVALENDCDNAI